MYAIPNSKENLRSTMPPTTTILPVLADILIMWISQAEDTIEDRKKTKHHNKPIRTKTCRRMCFKDYKVFSFLQE